MTDKLEDTSLRLKDEMDLYRKMMDKLRQNRLQFQKEKEAMQEVGGIIIVIKHTHTQSKVVCLLHCSLYSLLVFHTSVSQWLCHLIHLQITAPTLCNVFHPSFIVYIADRGPASRAGTFAGIQAGGRKAWPQPHFLLQPGGFQQQDQGGGARARGQETQAGTDERLFSNTLLCMSSSVRTAGVVFQWFLYPGCALMLRWL